jgi:hypothetical protein
MNPTLFELQRQHLQIAINRVEGGGSLEMPDQGLPFQTSTPPDATSTASSALMDNLLDNSDFDYSKDGFENVTPVGGDDDEEVYAWYRHRLMSVTDVVATAASPTINSASAPFKAAYTYPMNFVLYGAGGTEAQTLVGTLTRVSDTQATLSTNSLAALTGGILFFGTALAETDVQAIKADAHTLYAAAEGADADIPHWNKEDGWVEGGQEDADKWSLDHPLSLNFIRPSNRLFVLGIVKLRDGVLTDGTGFYAGIWDATAGQQRWLEGSNFTLNVDVVGPGTPGTSISYKAVGVLNDGSSIESAVVTVTSWASLGATNYNRLTWTNAPGILTFTLYRRIGTGDYKRIFTITNGSSDYNDTGGDEATVSGWPSTAASRPIAYKESTVYLPTVSEWTTIAMSFIVPNTYNMSNTTGKQWFRFGVLGNTDEVRQVMIDRLGLAKNEGGWNISSRDKGAAQQSPTSTPVGSDQGDSGTAYEEPFRCFDSMTLIRVEKGWLNIGDAEKGMFLWDGTGINRITKVKKAKDERFLVTMSNDAWVICTKSERFITSRADHQGTRLDQMAVGDQILSIDPATDRVSFPTIESIEPVGIGEVVTLTLEWGKHQFVVGNIINGEIKCLLAHNLKDAPGDVLQY